MTINKRRAPSSKVSSEKKLNGHLREAEFAKLIDGCAISGTQKGDVKDKKGRLYSVKSGKKWQMFLYGHDRISISQNLKILQPCLDAFTKKSKNYFEDRIKCIEFKEGYVKEHGRAKAKILSNEQVANEIGVNAYILSKEQLAKANCDVRDKLKDKALLREFIGEAIFNNGEVSFLAIKDSTYKKDEFFKVFSKRDVLDIFSKQLYPEISKAGNVPEDYNVPAQKTLLCYKKINGKSKKADSSTKCNVD
jgi:hypothetical protein